MKRKQVSKSHLRKRISYWIARFDSEHQARIAAEAKYLKLEQRLEWMLLKINQQRDVISQLGEEYKKAFRSMFAEETKKIMRDRSDA